MKPSSKKGKSGSKSPPSASGHELWQARMEQLERENAELKGQVSREAQSRLIAQEALGHTEDRLHQTLEAAQLALWEWDVQAQTVFTSARFGELIGDVPADQPWSAHALLARTRQSDLAQTRAALIRVLKGIDKQLEIECAIPRADGLLWLECVGGVTERSSSGVALRMVGVARDVTHRHTAHQRPQAAQPTRFALERWLWDVVTPQRAVAQAKGLSFDCSVDPQLPSEAIGDSVGLGQVLTHLLNNAMAFTQQGGVQVRLRHSHDDAERIWLRLEVLDSGVGMTPDQQRAILDSLAPANSATARRFDGTGSSLVKCAQWLQTMQGQMTLDSERGRGSSFSLLFPLTRAHGANEIEPRALRVAPSDQVALPSADAATPAPQIVDLSPDPVVDPDATEQASLEPPRSTGGTPLVTEFGEDDRTLAGVVTARVRPRQRGAAQANGVSSSQAPYHGQRALVVDDNPTNQLLATELMEQLGFAVEVAADGELAVEMAVRGGYQVVLMDVQMPQLDGFQACAEIRAWEVAKNKPHTPIVAVTANAADGDRDQAIAAGMDGYVSKPLTSEALAVALRALVRESTVKPTTRQVRQPERESQPPDSAPSSSMGWGGAGVVSAEVIEELLPPDPALSSLPPDAAFLVNRERMLVRQGGDIQALHEVAQAFCVDLRQRMGDTYEALRKSDWKTLRTQAYALRGALASITAERAAAQALELELAAENKDAEACIKTFNALSQVTQDVYLEVKNW